MKTQQKRRIIQGQARVLRRLAKGIVLPYYQKHEAHDFAFASVREMLLSLRPTRAAKITRALAYYYSPNVPREGGYHLGYLKGGLELTAGFAFALAQLKCYERFAKRMESRDVLDLGNDVFLMEQPELDGYKSIFNPAIPQPKEKPMDLHAFEQELKAKSPYQPGTDGVDAAE